MDRSFIQEFDASLKPVGAVSGFDGESYHTLGWQVTAVSSSRIFVTWERLEGSNAYESDAMFQRFRVGTDLVPRIFNPRATTVPYKAGAAATAFLKSASVSDADETKLSGHTLRVQMTSGDSSTNRIAFRQVSPAPGAKGFYFREAALGSRTLWYSEQDADSSTVKDFEIGTLNKNGGVGSTPF